jgi:hypothetical protein
VDEHKDGGFDSLLEPYISGLSRWLNTRVLGYYPIFGYYFRKKNPGKIEKCLSINFESQLQ